MACPYFFPLEKSLTVGWAFPGRLPLGTGHCGTCRAGESEFTPSDERLKDCCNLGYASCDRLPQQRQADCVRFSIGREQGERIPVQYVFEREHAPLRYGVIEYDSVAAAWLSTIDDACVQRQAECYLAVYLERRRK